jgi:hypothetical protein
MKLLKAPQKKGCGSCCSRLDDDRRLIAAGKAQRWEVFKWTVALNLGLSGTFAVLDRAKGGLSFFLAFSAAVAILGEALFLYYNSHMARVREEGNWPSGTP